MMPVRLFALANELRIESRDLIALCQFAGITYHLSLLTAIPDNDIDRIRAAASTWHLSDTPADIEQRNELTLKIEAYRLCKKEEAIRRSKRTVSWFRNMLLETLEAKGWTLVERHIAQSTSAYLRLRSEHGTGGKTCRVRLSDHYTNFDDDLAASIVMEIEICTINNESKHPQRFEVVDAITIYIKGRSKCFQPNEFQKAIEIVAYEIGTDAEFSSEVT